MQKKFFILLALLVVILLIAVWAYLFLNANPDTADDVFSDLNPGGELLPPLAPQVETATTTNNFDRPRLRQLTTKPVAGYVEKSLGTTTPPIVYFAEKGTGHIYTIDLETGSEIRVSGTTFAQAEKAVFSPNAKYVGISSGSKKIKSLEVGTISTSTNSIDTVFAEEVLDFSLTDTEVLFTTSGTVGAVGYSYNLKNEQRTNIFSLPFYDVTVDWAKTSSDSTYIYPKASFALEGYLYEIKNRTLNRLPASGFGFTAFANKDMIVYTARSNGTPFGYIINRTNNTSNAMQAPVYPDKCTHSSTGFIFYCAHEESKPPTKYPDTWYKGEVSYKDSLYRLSGATMGGELLIDTFMETNRDIDIINLTLGANDYALYFTNKNDDTLWMYEL